MEAEPPPQKKPPGSAEEEARRKIREQKTTERREKVQEKIDELKAKWTLLMGLFGQRFQVASATIADAK